MNGRKWKKERERVRSPEMYDNIVISVLYTWAIWMLHTLKHSLLLHVRKGILENCLYPVWNSHSYFVYWTLIYSYKYSHHPYTYTRIYIYTRGHHAVRWNSSVTHTFAEIHVGDHHTYYGLRYLVWNMIYSVLWKTNEKKRVYLWSTSSELDL